MKVYLSEEQRNLIIEALYVYSYKIKGDLKPDAKESIKEIVEIELQEIKMMQKFLEVK